MEYWSNGDACGRIIFSFNPSLPGPDLAYTASIPQTALPKYYRDNSAFQPTRARAGQRSMTPWPRPGLQGRSCTDSASEILQRQRRIPGKSRQGRPILNWGQVPKYCFLPYFFSRTMAIEPVLAISLIPPIFKSSRSAPSFSAVPVTSIV